jgi:uncharacterized zinc-type alcohol dehydrogenase-like protein
VRTPRLKSDWGAGIFPMVPGHEIAGTVSAVGSDVTKLRVDGVMANVGAPPENVSYNEFSLLGGSKVLAGS